MLQMFHLLLFPLPHRSTPLYLTRNTELQHATLIPFHNPVCLLTRPIHQPSLPLSPPPIPTQALVTSDTTLPIPLLSVLHLFIELLPLVKFILYNTIPTQILLYFSKAIPSINP